MLGCLWLVVLWGIVNSVGVRSGAVDDLIACFGLFSLGCLVIIVACCGCGVYLFV